jgi:hypothetical protein
VDGTPLDSLVVSGLGVDSVLYAEDASFARDIYSRASAQLFASGTSV